MMIRWIIDKSAADAGHPCARQFDPDAPKTEATEPIVTSETATPGRKPRRKKPPKPDAKTRRSRVKAYQRLLGVTK